MQPERPNYDCPARFEKTYRRIDMAKIPKEAKILIIGDAQMVESDYFKSLGYKNLTMAEYDYPEKGQITLDIENERLKEQFDVIFCSHVLEHCTDIEKAIGNMKSMCVHYYVFVPEVEICKIYDYHVSCLPQDEWERLLKPNSILRFMNNDQEEYYFEGSGDCKMLSPNKVSKKSSKSV
jgi:SAM-dependent methyltransferase